MFWTIQARYLIREHLSGNFSQNPDGDHHFMGLDKTFDMLPTGENYSTKTRHSLTKTVLDFLVIIGSLLVKNKIAGSGDCSHALIVYYNEIVILKLRTSITNKQTFTIDCERVQ